MSTSTELRVSRTNNWKDYGGMDVYVSQLLGSTDHSLFYTDETVKDAFKSYINTFVSRYADSSTIMVCTRLLSDSYSKIHMFYLDIGLGAV